MPALLAYSTSASPVLEEVAPPELGPADVRIQVAAAAVNPVDVAVLTGPVRAAVELPDPVGLGWDVSGTVTEVGGEVTGLSPGDRVAGILHVIGLKPSVGTHADETVLPADAVARVPDGLDLVEAASLPLNALTARQALDLLGPAEGRTLLVTGGAGAVGGHAVVLATRAGWRVTALARDADADFVARAGADPVTELPGPSFDAVLDAAVLLDVGAGRGPRRRLVRRRGPRLRRSPPNAGSRCAPSAWSPTARRSPGYSGSPRRARSRCEWPAGCRCARRRGRTTRSPAAVSAAAGSSSPDTIAAATQLLG